MPNCKRQTPFLCIAALAIPLVWPALAAYAQVESLADWPAKAKAGGYAEPLKVERVTVNIMAIGDAIRNGQWDDPLNDPPEFTKYYEKQVLPLITHTDRRGERQDVILKLRSDFKSLGRFPNSPVLNTLADITLAYMIPIVKDPKWHPSVRENALLAIGEVRSPKAVDALLEIIKDKNLHLAFKVVAMTDLVHLAEEGVVANSPSMPSVVAIATNVARSTSTEDSWRWMREQAADLLAVLGTTGTSGEVPDALLKMVADDKLPLIARGKAARALGKLNFEGGLPDAANYAKAFAAFGSDALDANLPGDAKRIWTVCEDFLTGIKPLEKSAPSPKTVHDMYDAMGVLKTAASKAKSNGGYPSEEELKPAVEKARRVLDAAVKK